MDLNLNGKKNILLLGNIILQLGFYIMYLVLLKENGIDKNLFFLSFLFSLSNGFSFLISIEEREKKYFYTVCISLIALHIYFILEPFLAIYIEDILLLRYFFLLQLIFSYMEIILEGQYNFTYFRGISFLYYLAIFILEIFLKQNTVFLNRINFYFLCLFPLLFFLVKRKDIEGYGLYSYKIILLTSLFLFIYLAGTFSFTEFWNNLNNYDEFYMMVPLVGILLYLLLKASSLSLKDFYSYIKEGAKYFLCILVFLLAVNEFSVNSLGILLLSFHLSIFILMLLSYVKYKELRKGDLEDLLGEGKESLLLEKYSQLYSERSSRFLHDSILQDIILVQKLVQRADSFTEQEQILQVLSSNIEKIRQEMNAYDPILNNKDSLSNNYYSLIKDLGDKYQNQEILVDFTCPDDLSLPGPYDRFIYKVLYELVTNLFKHSKGDYTEIKLNKLGNKISFSMVNFGDYLDSQKDLEEKNIGLRLLKIEVKRLGGSLQILEKKEEETSIEFQMEIPIKKELVYEDFVSRRS